MKKIKNHYFIYFLIIISLILLTAVISYLKLDLKLQSIFYQKDASEPWYQKNAPLWSWLYQYGPFPAIFLSAIALITLILSGILPKIQKFKKYCLLILLTLILGPGLIINGVLKDHWGRPRPRQVKEFGGKWEFHEVWQPGTPGKGKSFPCGHCSMGFLFIVLYYSLKRKHKALAFSSLIFSIIYGSLIGLARVAQGGHFLSDVLWAGGITYFLATLLYYDILKIPLINNMQADSAFESQKSTTKPWKIILTAVLIIFSLCALVFVLLFSKPVYKEYQEKVIADRDFNLIKFNFNIDKGNIIFVPNGDDYPMKIQTIIQGFGFPKYKFKRELNKTYNHDTLNTNFYFTPKGLFYELDISIKIFFDSSKAMVISGELDDGEIYVEGNVPKEKWKTENILINQNKAEIIQIK